MTQPAQLESSLNRIAVRRLAGCARFLGFSVTLVLASIRADAQSPCSTSGFGRLQNSSNSNAPLLVLENGLVPNAAMNIGKDIICVASNWISHYPLVAQRLDSTGRMLWNTVQVSDPQISGDQNGRALILPRPDGSAIFAFEYQEFRGFSGGLTFFAGYPHLQFIDRAGNVQWGVNGKRLTDIVVHSQSGASVILTDLAPDGDVVVYWTWFDQDSSGQNIFATYVQKVDHLSGDLKLGPSGEKLFTDRAILGVSSANGNTYLVHGGDSVACLDAYANVKWQLPLLEGITDEYSVGTNNIGEVLILYTTAEGIKGRLFGSDGVAQWVDKTITRAVNRILFGTKLTNWDDRRWVFSMGSSAFCVDRGGAMCWSDSGTAMPGKILDLSPVDDSNVVAAFQQARPGDAFSYDLGVQKLSIGGETKWRHDGIKILEYVGTTCHVLPDSNGGSYVVFDAVAQYDPQFRPRGTFWQRVDKDGHPGIVTSVANDSRNSLKTASVGCYPNPFINSTTFQIVVPMSTFVTLTVFDINGREVARLLSRNIEPGSYVVSWNATVPSGVYFCRMRTEASVRTQKFVILK